QNSYSKFINKLKYLKEKIRIWARLHKESLNSMKSILKVELADIDGVIDKGEGLDADGHRRREVVRLIQKVEKNDDLEREVSNEDIKRAVWDCSIDKAPGPDGLAFGFYRRYWDIIGNDVPNANMVKDFRPISVIGSLYKVIFKVLANRLVTVLDDIVDEIQSDFVDFIDDILRRFGFGEKWCKWIQSCLYSSRGSVLVNESPTKEFQFHKVDARLFNGIKLDSSLQISHLFYVDDVIFMGQWSQYNIDTIIRVLDVFYRALGLRINMNKSNLMGISVDSNKVKHVAAKIGAIPIYHMSIFKVPMKVLQNMESIRARFFNGADVNFKKPSWVTWKIVLAAKDVGGLGVSSLFALNRAPMFKWVWRFFSQNNSLWVRVVKALHGEDGKFGKKIQPRYPSTWLNIINEIESLKLHGIDLVSFITPKLGNGVNTSFWDVAWY
nr:RNA-directed DNA polymerase, eukaryota, reverse transcriptase zinc-binding domain protein [Tanacetum cinerariifolium]